jgi:hypothetical protein
MAGAIFKFREERQKFREEKQEYVEFAERAIKSVRDAATDAAVLYFALNGTDRTLSCYALPEEESSERCGRTPVVAVSSEDGTPLCASCAQHPGECAHLLTQATLEEIAVPYAEQGVRDVSGDTRAIDNSAVLPGEIIRMAVARAIKHDLTDILEAWDGSKEAASHAIKALVTRRARRP